MSDATLPSKSPLASIALIAMALAIAYLAYALVQLSRQIPAILKQVEAVTQQTGQTLEKVQPVLDTVPLLAEESKRYRELVPGILAEVEAVRGEIPGILQQVEATRGEIPEILERVDRLQAQIDGFQKDLPAVLKTVDQTNAVVADTNQQVAKIVPMIPEVLSQVEATRNEIPGYLTRVENIVASSKEISEEAGKGAVSGFLKGIISSPFDLLKGVGSGLRSGMQHQSLYADSDLELAVEASKQVLASNGPGTNGPGRKEWHNPESGNSGVAELRRSYQHQNRDCKTLLLAFNPKAGDKSESLEKNFCLNSDGQWVDAG